MARVRLVLAEPALIGATRGMPGFCVLSGEVTDGLTVADVTGALSRCTVEVEAEESAAVASGDTGSPAPRRRVVKGD